MGDGVCTNDKNKFFYFRLRSIKESRIERLIAVWTALYSRVIIN